MYTSVLVFEEYIFILMDYQVDCFKIRLFEPYAISIYLIINKFL